jgi:hypothetical protein
MMATKRKEGDEDRSTAADDYRNTLAHAEEDAGVRARSRDERDADEFDTGYGYADDRRARRGRRMVYRGRDEEYGEVDSLLTAVAVGGAAVALEAELLPGILIGAGAMLLGRMFPQIGGVVRPVLKTAVRAGYALTDTARGALSEANEQFRDVVAEVEGERGVRRPRRYQEEEAPRTRAEAEPSSGPAAGTT